MSCCEGSYSVCAIQSSKSMEIDLQLAILMIFQNILKVYQEIGLSSFSLLK